jgi:hypothetical protein
MQVDVDVIACGESTSVGYTIQSPLGRLHSLTQAYSTPFNAMPCPHFARHGDTLSPFPLPLPLPSYPSHPAPPALPPRHISPFLFHFRLQIDRVCSVLFLEAMLHHAMLYHAVPCRVVPSYATLCYAMLCYAMLCRTVSRHTKQWHIPSVRQSAVQPRLTCLPTRARPFRLLVLIPRAFPRT